MLAIFQKQVAHAPQELNSPRGASGGAASNQNKPRNPDEILRDFHAAHPTDAFSTSFGGGAALACVGPTASASYPRMFCGLDDIYCVFLGHLDNLSGLIRQYGLCGRSTNEALLVIEAYRTLRDRGPYPADQVVKDLAGAFAFVVFDNRSGAVFAALGAATPRRRFTGAWRRTGPRSSATTATWSSAAAASRTSRSRPGACSTARVGSRASSTP